MAAFGDDTVCRHCGARRDKARNVLPGMWQCMSCKHWQDEVQCHVSKAWVKEDDMWTKHRHV
jgi:ribosomal protein L37AE/L43A